MENGCSLLGLRGTKRHALLRVAEELKAEDSLPDHIDARGRAK